MTTPAHPTETAEICEALLYGIVDPDYARVFTIARCIAWQEGYALLMHGSFTRDLDMLAVPWTEQATDAEHLVRRIELALDDMDILIKKPGAESQATEKPHGRLAWTLTFKVFGDPRFVDLSVMPLTTDLAERDARIAALEGALKLCLLELEWQSDKAHTCGDPNFECPMQDISGPDDAHRIARDAARTALTQGATHADPA